MLISTRRDRRAPYAGRGFGVQVKSTSDSGIRAGGLTPRPARRRSSTTERCGPWPRRSGWRPSRLAAIRASAVFTSAQGGRRRLGLVLPAGLRRRRQRGGGTQRGQQLRRHARRLGGGGRPDLSATAVVMSPPAPVRAPGTTFSVTDTVHNVGAAPSGSSTTRYYLSLDAVKNAGDTLLTGSRAVPGLAGDASQSGTVTVTMPAATPLNTYFLLACATTSTSSRRRTTATTASPRRQRR